MIHAIVPVIAIVEVDSGISLADQLRWAAAQQRQLYEHFGPSYNILATCRVATTAAPLQPGEWPHYLHAMPKPGDPTEALAFHGRLPDGTPCMHTFVQLCRNYGDEPSSAFGHENLETLVDELLNEITMDMRTGELYAKEPCDACEAVGYTIDGIAMTDFCMPEWFSPPDKPDAATKYNWLGTMTGPYQILPGGYGQTYDKAKGGWAQVGQMRAYRAHLATLGYGRGVRRTRLTPTP